MIFRYDAEADAAYISVHDAIAPGDAVRQIDVSSPHMQGELIVDLDHEDRILGFEILGASRLLNLDKLIWRTAREPSARSVATAVSSRSAVR